MPRTVQSDEDRKANLARAREERFSSWFATRHWQVCTEITGTKTLDGYKVYYFRGFFQVHPPGAFETPLGRKGRSGYLIAEVDDSGVLVPGQPPRPFGRIVLQQAIDRFGSVTGLPARDPRRQGAKWQE